VYIQREEYGIPEKFQKIQVLPKNVSEKG